MFFFNTLVYVIFIALIFSLIFAALRNHGPWNNFWLFLIVMFLGLFAVSLWFPPVGPVWYGIAWLDLLLVGLVLALLLGAAGESRDRSYIRNEKGEVDIVAESKRESGAMTLAGILFWVFILALVISIVVGIMRRGTLL